MPADKTFKICLIGPVEVGKTTILKNYSKDQQEFLQTNNFNSQSPYSIMKIFNIDDKEILLNIWDFPSEFDNKNTIPLYLRGTNGILLIFDVSNKKSIKKLENWAKTLNSVGSYLDINTISLIVAGNKNDLDSPLKDQDTEKLVNKIQKTLNYKDEIPFFKVSAESNENIEEMFNTMLQLLLSKAKI